MAFGLHPNAEIGFKTRQAVSLCEGLRLLQACLPILHGYSAAAVLSKMHVDYS